MILPHSLASLAGKRLKWADVAIMGEPPALPQKKERGPLQEECRRTAIEYLNAARATDNREKEIVFLELAQRLRCMVDDSTVSSVTQLIAIARNRGLR